MPVFLGRRPVFPDPERADPDGDGLIAIGGRIDVPWLLAAYRAGVFPWYEEPPPLWWSLDPRLVLFPDELKVARSLRATIRKGTFETRYDTAFRAVMLACAETPRRHEQGTWITPEILRGYTDLHAAGYAHSVESWAEGELVGGLYGVHIGRCFFGESMFHRRTDASKVALVGLVAQCRARGIALIDCQMTTPHLVSLGAREVPRAKFTALVRAGTHDAGPSGPWTEPPCPKPAPSRDDPS